MSDLEDLLQPWVSNPDECHALAVAIMGLVAPSSTGSGIRDGNHALLMGRILGSLVRGDQAVTVLSPLQPEPVMAGRDYSNKIRVSQPSGNYIIEVRPA